MRCRNAGGNLDFQSVDILVSFFFCIRRRREEHVAVFPAPTSLL